MKELIHIIVHDVENFVSNTGFSDNSTLIKILLLLSAVFILFICCLFLAALNPMFVPIGGIVLGCLMILIAVLINNQVEHSNNKQILALIGDDDRDSITESFDQYLEEAGIDSKKFYKENCGNHNSSKNSLLCGGESLDKVSISIVDNNVTTKTFLYPKLRIDDDHLYITVTTSGYF